MLYLQPNDTHHFAVFSGAHIGFTVTRPNDNTDPRIFRTVVYNSEPGFNTATGIFVCRHLGMYLFTATIMREPGFIEASCYIRVIGSNKSRVVANMDKMDSRHYKGYPSSSATLVVHLNVGDDVCLTACSETDMHSESVFAGVLIQPDLN